jgi:XTP/dITP diphosphohydrolase
MITLLLATRNAHKVHEIRDILGNGISCHCLEDFPDAPHVCEDGKTFAENAAKKATVLAVWLKAVGAAATRAGYYPDFVLADDSGLEVDALNGAPGVLSARFAAIDRAEGNSSDTDNLNKLLQLLEDVPVEKRSGRFRCVLALTPVVPSPSGKLLSAREFEAQTSLFEGACEGRIAFGPRGKGGFGYDPIFIPMGYEQSFAELGDLVKNGLSHRARALAQLKASLTA